jgi:hypothetical protein
LRLGIGGRDHRLGPAAIWRDGRELDGQHPLGQVAGQPPDVDREDSEPAVWATYSVLVILKNSLPSQAASVLATS